MQPWTQPQVSPQDHPGLALGTGLFCCPRGPTGIVCRAGGTVPAGSSRPGAAPGQGPCCIHWLGAVPGQAAWDPESSHSKGSVPVLYLNGRAGPGTSRCSPDEDVEHMAWVRDEHPADGNSPSARASGPIPLASGPHQPVLSSRPPWGVSPPFTQRELPQGAVSAEVVPEPSSRGARPDPASLSPGGHGAWSQEHPAFEAPAQAPPAA